MKEPLQILEIFSVNYGDKNHLPRTRRSNFGRLVQVWDYGNWKENASWQRTMSGLTSILNYLAQSTENEFMMGPKCTNVWLFPNRFLPRCKNIICECCYSCHVTGYGYLGHCCTYRNAEHQTSGWNSFDYKTWGPDSIGNEEFWRDLQNRKNKTMKGLEHLMDEVC